MKTPTPAQACCSPLLDAPLGDADARELAAAFKALADPVRLRLLSLIASAADGTACSCDLEEPVVGPVAKPGGVDEAGLTQDPQVVADERLGNVEGFDDVADAQLLGGEQFDDAPAHRFG